MLDRLYAAWTSGEPQERAAVVAELGTLAPADRDLVVEGIVLAGLLRRARRDGRTDEDSAALLDRADPERRGRRERVD
jgi:hypothetical protein